MNKKKLISSLGFILKNKKPVLIFNNYKGMLKRMDKALEQINLIVILKLLKLFLKTFVEKEWVILSLSHLAPTSGI